MKKWVLIVLMLISFYCYGENMDQKVILCIPGSWNTREELLKNIFEKSNGYIFAGKIIMKINDKSVIGILDIQEHDESLETAFRIAGQGKLSSKTLEKIKNHTLVLYLITEHVGIENIQKTMDLGCALLDSGGIAVKVETAGVAHEASTWHKFSKSEDVFSKYSAFIALIGGEANYYSCGMQNFGLPDCSVPQTLSINEAAELLNIFNMYQIVEKPVLNTNETFSLDSNSPYFVLHLSEYSGYDKDEPLYNKFGKWELTKR